MNYRIILLADYLPKHNFTYKDYEDYPHAIIREILKLNNTPTLEYEITGKYNNTKNENFKLQFELNELNLEAEELNKWFEDKARGRVLIQRLNSLSKYSTGFTEIYIDNPLIKDEWDNLIGFYNSNETNCVDYTRTLKYVLSEDLYTNQIKNYIEQFKEGINSIDCEFVDDQMDKDTTTLIKEIKEKYTCEDFQTKCIQTVYNYFEASAEEL